MKKLIYIIVGFHFFITSVNHARHLEFQHLTTVHGLSDNSVLCIHQDRQGFMWFGTQNGLNQYDGYRYRVFQHDPSDSVSISANQVNCILEDLDGNLWIGTDVGGLNRYSWHFDSFKCYQNHPEDSTSLPDDFVNSLFQDSQGRLWVGTPEGVSQYPCRNPSGVRSH